MTVGAEHASDQAPGAALPEPRCPRSGVTTPQAATQQRDPRGEAQGAGLAAVQYARYRLLSRCAGRGARPPPPAPGYLIPARVRSSGARSGSHMLTATGIRPSQWTARVAGWAMGSSSGCGTRSSTNAFISTPSNTRARPRKGSGAGSRTIITSARMGLPGYTPRRPMRALNLWLWQHEP